MESFNEYHKDPSQFPFLKSFQTHWQPIRDEFTHFINNASPAERHLQTQVMGPKSKTITTRGKSKYQAFGVLFQGLFIEDYIRTYQISYPDYAASEAAAHVLALREKYFPRLTEAIKQTNNAHKDVIRNVYFGTFLPGLDVKLHVNYNPHMNRGYLGLIVPKGDVAMQICHETLHWHEGKFMVLDHSYPHCPHNHTPYDRTVLIVDFFRTDRPRAEVAAFERSQVTQRMQDNPYSLGVFGENDQAKAEDFIKYGLAHQLAWDKVLSR
ncbi:MAG: aspartyl/asparaginyl beta-hydroxylase domain-containing protein [Phormidesmis sp.]